MRTQIGQYLIEAPLGRGGMGVVYQGAHEHLGRQVAIKALAPELTQQPEFKERFFSEAKTQARLQHPNIVGVYDLLEDGGEYFIVMELVAGEGLDNRMKASTGSGMDLHEAVGVFSQVLAALDYAHSEGVIHRDIKPSNVMITAGGRVKLTDFGIALLIGDKRLTASQSSIGTPTYMSPEQILRPRSVDHRTDLYSAAVVFYEMLAGKPPFDDETEYGIKKLHVEAPLPDISELRPGLPPGLLLVLATALNKNPEGRFASAGLFLRALQEAVPQGIPQEAAPLPAPVYRPTAFDGTRAGAETVAPPAAAAAKPAAPAVPQGKNMWIALAAGSALALALVLGGVFWALSSGGDEDKVADATVSPAVPAAPEPVPAGAALPVDGQLAPLAETPGGVPPSSLATQSTQPQQPSRPVSQPITPRPPRTKVPDTPPPAPVAPPAEPPPPATARAPEEPRPTTAADAGLDLFKQMEDLVVSIEGLGKKTFKAYEEEGREDQLYGRLEAFLESAVSLRREFRKVTGTGIRGIGENMKNMFRRGGQGSDTRSLEIKMQDLSRRADEIDGLISSAGPTAQDYWQEIRGNLRRLKAYF